MAPRQRHVGTAPGALPRLCLAAAPPAESSVSAGCLRLLYGLLPKAAVPSPAFHLPLPSERSSARTRPPANFSNDSLTQARHASLRPAGRFELHTHATSLTLLPGICKGPCHSTGFQTASVEVEAQLVQTREGVGGVRSSGLFGHRTIICYPWLSIARGRRLLSGHRRYRIYHHHLLPPPAPFNFVFVIFYIF